MPETRPPINAVDRINNIGSSFFSTSKAILCARMFSFWRLIYAAIPPQNKKMAIKDDKKERYLFWGIRNDVMDPANAIDHHGIIIPIDKASKMVAAVETRNLFICLDVLL